VQRLSDLRGKIDRRVSPFMFRRRVVMRNDRPIVSFTFDDIPESAALVGATIIEQNDALATFYVAGGLIDTHTPGGKMATRHQVDSLQRRGHEIGSHTYNHVRLSELSPADRQREIDENAAWFQETAADRHLSSFAYPFGDVTLASKHHMSHVYSSCRTTEHGLQSRTADLAHLRAVHLYSGMIDEKEVDVWLQRTVKQNGWLIFYTHDVGRDPSRFGCTPELLQSAVAAAQGYSVDVLPVRSAVGRIAFPPA
jgi:peptidoglycan/xylan/chitin deacetylase (PgdA/CDA1 family)